jgi:DHA1 family bicyclomycin/chloramphenicol resistance-like MFS transporter
MSSASVVWLLSLLLGLQPITTDLYLPSLPAIREGFGASMAQAQLTLTALLLAFGCAQLVLGPLSDRFGRRPVLLWGMAAYVAASIGAALAPTMDLLIAWRAVQGAAMGAAVVCARAIVRDLYGPVDGARAMSRAMSGLGVIACLSAPVGGLLAGAFGWRWAMLALTLFGAATLALLAWRLVESAPGQGVAALRPGNLAATWWTILRHPTFLAYSALCVCSYGGLFTFLAASSFVFIKVLGLSTTAYGLVMFSASFSYIVGTFMARRLLRAMGVRRAVALAGGLSIVAGSAMGLLAMLEVQNVAAVSGPMALFMLGHGVHQSCGQSGAAWPFPQAAGAASALNGFLMMLAAFAMGLWLGQKLDHSTSALAYGLWFWSAGIALTAWTLVQWHGEPGL